MLRVLIVDDSRDDAELAEFALREAGVAFECRSLHRPAALAATLEEGFVPDLVLCDLNLPGWSCGDALDAVRRRAPDAHLVILTGADVPPDCVLPEADAVLLKDELHRLAGVAQALTA